MKIPLARLISIIGHPFVLLVLLLFLTRFQNNPGDAARRAAALIVIVLVLVGMLTWRSCATGRWRTVDASDKADRPALYLCIALVLPILGLYFYFTEHARILVRGSIVVALMILAAAALNRWHKISLHLAFATFCGVLLSEENLRYGLPILIVLPALLWSRLMLSRHTLGETISGACLGLTGALALLFV